MEEKYTNIKERVLYFAKYKGVSVESFLKEIGMTYGSFKGKAKKGSLNSDAIDKMLTIHTELNPNWLISGEGDMISNTLKEDSPKYEKDSAIKISEDEFMLVPAVVNYAKAGYLAGFQDPEYMENLPKMLVPKEYEEGNYQIFETDGDSMDDNSYRALKDGDKYLTKELPRDFWTHKLQFNKYLFVIVSRKGMVFKQIVSHQVKTGIITCHSFNDSPEYKDYNLNLFEDVSQLFYIKKLIERKVTF